KDSKWPIETRGIQLGLALYLVRQGYHYRRIYEALREMGVAVDTSCDSTPTPPDFDRNFTALTVFKQLNGHCRVPQAYEIPENDNNYSREAWGIKLGRWLTNIRVNGYYEENKQRLIDLGVDFIVKPVNKLPFEDIYSALCAYKS